MQPVSTCRSASSYKISLNRTIGWWVMAKKAIFKMAAAAILNFKNFNFWSRDCHRVQYLLLCTKFYQNWTFFTEIWWFSGLQNGVRPPSWVCYDVTILHRWTHFHYPNTVRKFMLIGVVVSEILAISYVALLPVHNGLWQFWGYACAVSRDP